MTQINLPALMKSFSKCLLLEQIMTIQNLSKQLYKLIQTSLFKSNFLLHLDLAVEVHLLEKGLEILRTA